MLSDVLVAVASFGLKVPDILVLGSQQTQGITRNGFRISLQPDWQMDSCILQILVFNWAIKAHTQILVYKWGPSQELRRCFADEINQKFSSVCGAG